MPGRAHSRELKLTVCRQIQSGEKRPAQICREHSLDQSVLSRWRKEFAERGEQNAFLPKQPVEISTTEALEKRITNLEQHCGRLSLENDLLKKLVEKLRSRSYSPGAPRRDCRYYPTTPLAHLCAALGVNPFTRL